MLVSARLGSLPFGLGINQEHQAYFQAELEAGEHPNHHGHDDRHDHQDPTKQKYNGTALDSQFSKYVEDVMHEWNVTGLALVVLKPDGSTEFGNWGKSTEDGDPVTPDVRSANQ